MIVLFKNLFTSNAITSSSASQLNLEIDQKKADLLKDILAHFIIFLLAMNLFYPLFFEDQAIFYRDFHFITYPFRYFLAQAYQNGVMPYWTQHVWGGMPFLASFHPGVFYPPSIVFFLKDTLFALNLFYFIHFLVMGSFLYLLAKFWEMSFLARLCTAATGMLSGFLVASTLTSNFFIGAVWLPMVFWMYLKFRREGRIRYFVGAVFAIATQTLAACPEINIMTMVLLYVYCLWFMPKEERKTGFVRVTASMGLATVLALGISAIQLGPTAALLDHSYRNDGISYKDHTGWSLEPEQLTTLAITSGYSGVLDGKQSPFAFFGLIHTIYMGLIGMTLLVLGFCFRKDKTVGFWLLVFLSGILLSLGKYNVFYRLIYDWVPMVDKFRFPQKYFYISSFALTFLVGFVLDLLVQKKKEINIKWVIALVIAMFAAVSIIGLQSAHLEMEFSLTLLAAFGFIYILFHFGKFNKKIFGCLVLMLIVLDLSVKGFQLLPLIDRKFYDEQPLYMDILSDSYGNYRIYSGRIEKEINRELYPNGNSFMDALQLAKQFMRPYVGMYLNVEHYMGLPGLALGLQDHMIMYAVLQKSKPERRRRILRRSNVKYWLNQDRSDFYTLDGTPIVLPDFVEIFKDALPRAFLVPSKSIPGKGHVLNTYYEESFDPQKEVLLSEEVNFQPSPTFSGKVEEVTYSPNHVTVRTTQEGNGFLVLMDSYFPGWTLKVDGEERPILRANHYYRAVQLGPGSHTLEFDYFPDGFREGLIVSGVSLILGAAGCFLWRRHSRKPVLSPQNDST